MAYLRIVLLCLAAAVGYGILQDQITARVCVEYFTVGHPPVFPTEDPSLLALGWGVLATWWVGILLGVPLALAARVGPYPKLNARELVRPIMALMTGVGLVALVAGVMGYVLARLGVIWLVARLAERVPAEKHALFLADGWAHSAAYAAGFLGGLMVIWRVRSRRVAGRR